MEENTKIPPNATDLEEAVLGAIMLEKHAFLHVSFLTKEMFYEPKNSQVFSVCQDLSRENSPIDVLTVTNKLRKSGELDSVGGAYYITQLTNRVSSSANVEYHAYIIKEKYLLREIASIVTNTIEMVYEYEAEPIELLAKTAQQLSMLSATRRQEVTITDTAKKSVERMREMYEKGDNSTIGVPYGNLLLDARTGGKRKGHFIIIGGRPSMGKTALLTSIVVHTAITLKVPVVVFSLETLAIDLSDRIISTITQIPINEIEKGNAIMDGKLHNALEKIEGSPLYFDTDKELTVYDIKAKIALYKMKYGIEEVYIDFLQLVKVYNNKHNRNDGVGEITRELKIIAQNLEISIIALAQLNRAVETRPDKKPMLQDLRDSGNIEQDADEVLFLYRPCYYNLKDDRGVPFPEDYAEINVAKHKTAGVGWLPIKFIGKTVTYTDWNNIDQTISEF